MKQFSVCAGIVAHNPESDEVKILIQSLLSCAKWVVIVDNCSLDNSYLKDLDGNPEVNIIYNSRNNGVSGGINQVIEYARQMGAEYVSTYDQDTKITPNLVNVLVSDFEKLVKAGEPVAVIGPSVIDDFTNYRLPFIHFRVPFNRRYEGQAGNGKRGLVECDFLISSGCVMSMKAIDEIGPMNESLFIDNVDLDWCFRATYNKYKVYGDFNVTIRQKIGKRYTRIPFTKALIRYHDASRNYFMTRNRMWLYRQVYAKKSWVFHDFYRFSCKFLYLLVFKRGRIVLLKTSIKAVYDSFFMMPYERRDI